MAGQQTLKTTSWLRKSFETAKLLYAEFVKLNTMLTELFTNHTVTYYIPTHASRTAYNVFIAKRGYTVVGVDFVPDVAQGATLTATVVKVTGTSAPSAGTTPLHSGTLNCNGTANTVQTATLTTTSADLVLASGNRIGVVLSGALSTGAGLLVINMKKT